MEGQAAAALALAVSERHDSDLCEDGEEAPFLAPKPAFTGSRIRAGGLRRSARGVNPARSGSRLAVKGKRR